MKKIFTIGTLTLIIIFLVAGLTIDEAVGFKALRNNTGPEVSVKNTSGAALTSQNTSPETDAGTSDNKSTAAVSTVSTQNSAGGDPSPDSGKSTGKTGERSPPMAPVSGGIVNTSGSAIDVGNAKAGASVEEKNSSTVTPVTSKTERKIDPDKPMVALTFDDGPSPKHTPELLKELKKYNGAATFFVIGKSAEKNPKIIKSIIENGNQLGNHTYDHKELTKLNSKQISDEITKTQNIIQKITGTAPKIVRPSYGSINETVRQNTGYPLLLWSIDTKDWKTRNKDMIVKEVLGKVKSGDIVLMHDIYDTTIAAAKVIMKELNSRGYQMVTVEELYKAKNVELKSGVAYSGGHFKTVKTVAKP